jgi:hypothetical protein
VKSVPWFAITRVSTETGGTRLSSPPANNRAQAVVLRLSVDSAASPSTPPLARAPPASPLASARWRGRRGRRGHAGPGANTSTLGGKPSGYAYIDATGRPSRLLHVSARDSGLAPAVQHVTRHRATGNAS